MYFLEYFMFVTPQKDYYRGLHLQICSSLCIFVLPLNQDQHEIKTNYSPLVVCYLRLRATSTCQSRCIFICYIW